MANMPFAEAFQDESYLLEFILNNPWHAVVLGRIATAMEKYQVALRTADLAQNSGMQKDVALVTRFLKYEASDRVNIKFEYLVVDAFESLRGQEAVALLLEHQKRIIAERECLELGEVLVSQRLLQAFDDAGLNKETAWGVEGGKANVVTQIRLRLARHYLFELTREMHRAYCRGDRAKSRLLKYRRRDARKFIGPLANIECKSKALTVIKALFGEDESKRVLACVKSNSRLQEYEAIRDEIQSRKFVIPYGSGGVVHAEAKAG